MKRCSIVITEMQIKTTWDATTHILEFVKQKHPPTPQRNPAKLAVANAVKDMEQQEFSFSAGGNAQRYSHFWGQFEGSFV